MALSVPKESAFKNARSLFKETALSWRGLVVLIACEATVGGIGTYMANSGSHSARVQAGFTVAAVAGAALQAFVLIFLSLWATAPRRMLGQELTALSERVELIANTVQSLGGRGTDKAHNVRVALFAVRSELGACAGRIVRAKDEYARWWDPELDPLPTQKWTAYFADLTRVPDALNTKIDLAYQTCDHLNHLAGWYIAERKRLASPFASLAPKAGPTSVTEYDKEQLAKGLKEINETNKAISAHLDEAE
jgi:hypothetical protein